MKNKYYAIFGVLFLLLSLGGAIYLSFQNADTRNRAATKYATYDECRLDKGKVFCDNYFGLSTPTSSDEELKLGRNECGKNGNPGAWCDACGGFCISMKTLTCNQAGIKKCNEYPSVGSTYILGGDASHPYKCNCNGKTYGFDTPGVCTFKNGVATQVTTNMPPGAPNYSQYKGRDEDGLCNILTFTPVTTYMPSGFQNGFWCPNQFDDLAAGCQKEPIPANFNYNCFCGTIQIDTAGSGFREQTMKCGCDKPKRPTNTPPKRPTNTPTRRPTRTPTPTSTPTGVYNSPTPTPTGVYNSPTPTPTEVYNSPTPTPTVSNLGCGYTPCDDTGKICSSGLVCVTADNSNQYCSQPELTEACKINPGYVGCCTVPNTEGPSPTRIVLPVSGFNFPVQALTIIGGITTLLGFLILL